MRIQHIRARVAARRWDIKMRKKKMTRIIAVGLLTAAVWILPNAGLQVQAAEEPAAIYVQMPGFVVEQWSVRRLMAVNQNAVVRVLPDQKEQELGRVEAGQFVYAWGQTDTGWYFIECNGTLGYVRYEAAAFASQEQTVQAQETLAQAAALAQQQAQAAALAQQQAQAAALAQQQAAQIAAAAAQQPAVTAGIVFIGDSRMVTLKEAVENNLGPCAATVIAKGGSRYEWFYDTAIPQADRIIGKGSKVVINMGVNDLSDADKYAQQVNYWAAVWTARGAKIYYASVNPVWANSYGMTEERVELFNSRLQSQLIPQVTWLDSHTYLLQTGVHATDGVHYKDDTNLVLYNYYMTMIGAV